MALLPLSFEVPGDVVERAAQVRLLVLDVDGVLTDGSLFLDDKGREYKAFHSRDGHGLKMLRGQGVEVAVITGRTSGVVKHRMHELGVERVYQGCADKLPFFHQLLDELGMDAEHTAYVGDDVVDLPVLLNSGFAVAVADAHPLVREHAHWTTPSAGGRGAARECAELLLFAHDRLDAAMEPYFAAPRR
ncbi:MAG: 3-deoxy-manno-octulosonate-8-phosphatase KdsC [Gammaproteobacteria bacterium]|jgi:3-deoxy-D-manno-octulosonate 8-phosphate phosphatase (KDO 8-P phosphatase)|nr:3-deoxy-manno-octulosonate-8-phosphatase KdsC [Gammaproteobacteria bacterium]